MYIKRKDNPILLDLDNGIRQRLRDRYQGTAVWWLQHLFLTAPEAGRPEQVSSSSGVW